MSPKYQILDQVNTVVDGEDGTLVTVNFIPVIDGAERHDLAEEQKYFIKSGENIANVLSRAAWNHEDTIKESLTPSTEPAPAQEIQALPKNQL